MNRRTAIAAILAIPVMPQKRTTPERLRDGQVVVANLHGECVRMRVDGNKLRIVGGSGFLPREHLGAFDWSVVK
jgi:hypothetical protein